MALRSSQPQPLTTGSSPTFGGLTLTGALTYGGITLTNAVTGTGKMVLDTSPTLSGASLTGGGIVNISGNVQGAQLQGNNLLLTAAAPAAGASQVGYGNNVANGTAAPALTANKPGTTTTILGWISVNVAGTAGVVPVWNAS